MTVEYICVLNLKDNLPDNFRSFPVFLKIFKAFPLFSFFCAKFRLLDCPTANFGPISKGAHTYAILNTAFATQGLMRWQLGASKRGFVSKFHRASLLNLISVKCIRKTGEMRTNELTCMHFTFVRNILFGFSTCFFRIFQMHC